ncbi:glutathione S-transferase Ure2-like protein [Apodospora peruviana]|uniref:Glutathione S-transferase Ure2-like protein n=1 Tax=Apodospora peruviana TaxID=516989 RepID=A0AAE0HYH2_9PEZI|nr:glutathione S-transferase Ure2-like protein [Apodospora peruviana]
MSTFSTTQLKPIKVWGKGGPNPPKVAMVLNELGLPYEIDPIPLSDVKKPEYTAINPNGRLPSIHDPNTDLTLWESGAIVLYLVDRYDTAEPRKISFAPGTPEAYKAQQWLFFQASGQGPYYGQAAWFKKFHNERLPSALERYVKEVHRVTAVVEGHLAKQREDLGEEAIAASGGPWLVGNKYSYADLAWLSWQTIVSRVVGVDDGFDPAEYPVVADWMARMLRRAPIAAAMGASEQLK